METSIINIPEKKSTLVEQILKGLGIVIQSAGRTHISAYKQKLANISVWTDDHLKLFEESKNALKFETTIMVIDTGVLIEYVGTKINLTQLFIFFRIT